MIWIYITLGISIVLIVTCAVLAVVGKCHIGYGYENWGNKRCEWLYYHIFAPLSCLFILACAILLAIYLPLK